MKYKVTVKQRIRDYAYYCVRKDLALGVLIKPDVCEQCKKQPPRVAHHPDYRKPHSVIWLCWHCHYYTHNPQFIGSTAGERYRERVREKRGLAKLDAAIKADCELFGMEYWRSL